MKKREYPAVLKSVTTRQFSIRAILAAVLVVAIASRFGPTLYRRLKYAEHYAALREIDWKRNQGAIEGYEFRAANGVLLSVWTTEHEYSRNSGLMEPKSFTPDASRFYVIPPGRWVHSLDEVLKAWDDHQ